MHLGYSLIIKQGTSPTIFIVININSWKCTLKVDFPNSSHQYFLQGWFLSVQFSCSVVSNSLQPHGLQHTRPPCPLPTPRVYSNSCPLSWWCHPTISSSVIPFSSCLQSFPASGFSSNESVLCIRWPKYWSFSFNISPSYKYSGLISFRMDWLDPLQFKGLSRVFSNTTVQKHHFFGTQLSL